jgi:hypothetical protein
MAAIRDEGQPFQNMNIISINIQSMSREGFAAFWAPYGAKSRWEKALLKLLK